MMATSLVHGTVNFRDTGGLPVGDSLTRHGVLFRSGNLATITPEGETDLASLGLKRIIDLRDDEEVNRQSSRAGDIPISRVPLFVGSVASFFTESLGLTEMYRTLVDDSSDRVLEVVRGVLADQPVLVHCTVGKDRTGVTVAITLAAAGVVTPCPPGVDSVVCTASLQFRYRFQIVLAGSLVNGWCSS